ncbi:lasso peptide biosynthesis B2 protein [Geodermatophilus sp. Leaf369]|uniref:lasso peptide biosynthesis B2 protein n=1 Tax=Geodermatophilus sp. Leaf369 TaxID=1736354 RepID=UPI0009E94028|nr:lasso peptide biosynthesis B2 protein [Geodermatophilus sp. Leaf369]
MIPRPAPSRLHDPARWGAYRREPLTGRLAPATLRAAWWARTAVRRARRALAADGVDAVVAPPPALPAGARRGVEAVLRRTAPTCLERSLVLQAWLAAHGVPCEVVVGVAGSTGGDGGVRAHAWLDVEAHDPVARGYREIHRLPPR